MEGSVGFLGAFIITLVQGILLNVVLMGYMTVILGDRTRFSTPSVTTDI